MASTCLGRQSVDTPAAACSRCRHSCLLRFLPMLCRFSHSFGRSVLTVVSAVAVDFLAIGAVIATLGWGLSNKFLRRQNQHSHAVEQSVEWCAVAAHTSRCLGRAAPAVSAAACGCHSAVVMLPWSLLRLVRRVINHRVCWGLTLDPNARVAITTPETLLLPVSVCFHAGCMLLTCTATHSSPCFCSFTCSSWRCAPSCSCTASWDGCCRQVR